MNIEFNSSGGTNTVKYAINCDGEVRFASSDNSWLHIEFGNGVLTISADTYDGQSDRTGTITPSVNGTDCPNKVINVTQKKGSQPDCEVANIEYNFGYIEDNIGPCDTSVELKIPYTATTKYTDSEQCEDEINEGFSSVTVTFDDVNCEEEPKTITGDHYKVTQKAGPCGICDCTDYIYRVSFPGETLELGACATSATLDVTAKRICVSPEGEIDYTPKVYWSKTGDSGITISSTEGTAITVSGTNNCVEDERTAIVSVSAYTIEEQFIDSKEIIVTQVGGCGCECTEYYSGIWAELETSPGFWNQYYQEYAFGEIDNCGDTLNLKVGAHYNCDTDKTNIKYDPNGKWKISDDMGQPDYVHLSTTDNTQTILRVGPNYTNSPREIILEFSGYCVDDSTKLAANTYGLPNHVKFIQPGGCEEPDTCICDSTKVTQISNNLPYTSGNNVKLADVDVESECINRFSFTSSNSNFINSNSIRINNGDIIGNVTENSSENERSTTITVMFDSTPCTSITIRQDGKPAEGCPDYVITYEDVAGKERTVKFGAKLNGVDLPDSVVSSWTWGWDSSKSSDDASVADITGNTIEFDTNDTGEYLDFCITYSFTTGGNVCSGETIYQLKPDEIECKIVAKSGVTGNCFCDGIDYEVWLEDTCNPGTKLVSNTDSVVWEVNDATEWAKYGSAINRINRDVQLVYNNTTYDVSVTLDSLCIVRQVKIELYANQDDIAGGTIDLGNFGVTEIPTQIGNYTGFDISGYQSEPLRENMTVDWNPTDDFTYCDSLGDEVLTLNIEFPEEFDAIINGDTTNPHHFKFREDINKWGATDFSDYISLTPEISIENGEVRIRIHVKEGNV